MHEYKTHTSIVGYKSDWMTIYEDWVRKDENTTSMFNRIEVSDATIIVPIFQDGSLLMVENYRYAIHSNLLELPGGFINQNEKAANAAKRELLEETGYTCNKLKFIRWFYTWPGRTAQKNFVFVGRQLIKDSDQKLEDYEFIKVHKISISSISQEIRNGKIKGAGTIAALFYGYFSIDN